MLFSSKQYQSKQRMQMQSTRAELNVNLFASKTCYSAGRPVTPWNMRSMGKATISAEKELLLYFYPFSMPDDQWIFTINMVQLIDSNNQILFHSDLCITVLVQIHMQLFSKVKQILSFFTRESYSFTIFLLQNQSLCFSYEFVLDGLGMQEVMHCPGVQ